MLHNEKHFETRRRSVLRKTVRSRSANDGATLIELLVVISIMGAVALLVIPQIRTVSKDRTMRETSRTVKAAFDEAITRARVEGFGGVVIARNPNIYRLVDTNEDVPNLGGSALVPTGSKVYYAGHVLYQMRRPRPYTGNTNAEVATVVGGAGVNFVVEINAPFDSRVKIEPGGKIYFSNSPTGFTIDTVIPKPGTPDPGPPPIPPQLILGCSGQPFESFPRTGAFRIMRRPEIIPSSAVALPRGQIINLNYSGVLDMARVPPIIPDVDNNDFTWTDMSQDLLPIDRTHVALNDTAYQAGNALDPITYPQFVDPNTQPVMIIFGHNGTADTVFPNGILVNSWVQIAKANNLFGYDGTDPRDLYRTAYTPSSSLSFCIASDEFENTFSLDNTLPGYEMPLSFTRAARDLLNDSTVQWVTVDHISGDVSVADSIQVQGTLVFPGPNNMAALQIRRILNARGFAANTTSAKD